MPFVGFDTGFGTGFDFVTVGDKVGAVVHAAVVGSAFDAIDLTTDGFQWMHDKGQPEKARLPIYE